MRKQNRTQFSVLGMLTFDDMTGYEIAKIMKTSTNNFWSESEGQIYPALAQCLEAGWVTCKEVKSKEVKRIKKIYSISSKGKKALKDWLKKECQETLVRNELLLKLFFGANLDLKENMHHIQHHQKEIENEIKSYEIMQERLVKEHPNSPHLKYWQMTLNYGIKILKADLAWCKESLKILMAEEHA